MSSFAGDGVDVAALKAAAGVPVWFVPNFHPGKALRSTFYTRADLYIQARVTSQLLMERSTGKRLISFRTIVF